MNCLAGSNGSIGHEGLVERCVGGDEAAWGVLFTRHRQSVRSFLRRMGVPADSLDDACQDVFIEAFRFLPGFRGDCQFQTWLFRLCMTQARQARRKLQTSETLRRLLTVDRSRLATRGEFDEQSKSALVEQALDTMNEQERLAFVLYEFEGWAGLEIAKVANCPEMTVWTRLHAARKKFKKSLSERAGLQ